MSGWLRLAVAGLVGMLLAVWQMGDVETSRRAYASLALLCYLGLLLRYGRRQRQRSGGPADCDYLIAFATETGTARELARQTQNWLRKKGASVLMTELNRLRQFPAPRRVLLLVASTCGEGEAPRTGRQWLDEGPLPAHFSGCHYAVLALGDRHYPNYCAFGQGVALELRDAGAIALFEPILASQADPQAVRYWFDQLEATALT